MLEYIKIDFEKSDILDYFVPLIAEQKVYKEKSELLEEWKTSMHVSYGSNIEFHSEYMGVNTKVYYVVKDLEVLQMMSITEKFN